MIHNFNAGPSILPKEVFEKASHAILNYNNSELSILEIGHRSPNFVEILEEARNLVKELLNLKEHHEVLFLQGGASTQFFQIPMNLLNENETAAYTNTGTWAAKAIKEAKLFGNVFISGSSKETNYTSIPKNLTLLAAAKYLHLTSNETISGTQWKNIPYECGVPLVADMSSDIFSRVLDFNKFDIIYAGAQKNMGAAGVTLVIINKNCLGKVDRFIPTMLDYRNHIQENNLLNTPPVFAIYVALLTLRWIKQQGGVPAMEKINQQKAALLYDTIDKYSLFQPIAAKEDRSMMNATFTISDKSLEEKFLNYCAQENIIGIKGHRTVGGFRVSLYNALPLESVQFLTKIMCSFADSN